MMFREMRRDRQSLSREDCISILERGTSGVLALSGDGGYPYAVPLSYLYHDGALYFHCAKSGHKLDAIRSCPRASFCVIGQDQIVPLRRTTFYRSVIAFGSIDILEEAAEKRRAIDALTAKYASEDSIENRNAVIERQWDLFYMLKFSIEHLSGKQARGLLEKQSSAP